MRDKCYIRDTFEKIIDEISSDAVFPLTCCDEHSATLLPKLILDYVIMRFRFAT